MGTTPVSPPDHHENGAGVSCDATRQIPRRYLTRFKVAELVGTPGDPRSRLGRSHGHRGVLGESGSTVLHADRWQPPAPLVTPAVPELEIQREEIQHQVSPYAWVATVPSLGVGSVRHSGLLGGGVDPAGCLAGGDGLEVKGARVDAVALAGGPGPVTEDVPQVRPAAPAAHLGADHPVADVAVGLHRLGDGRLGEAGPARLGVELGRRRTGPLRTRRSGTCRRRGSPSTSGDARSVPALRSTWNCSGVSSWRHSSSVFWILSNVSLLGFILRNTPGPRVRSGRRFANREERARR